MSNLVMIWYLDSKKGKRVKEKFARKNFQSTKDWLEREGETTLQGSERNKKNFTLETAHDCSFGNLLYFDYVQALRVTLSYFHFEIGNSCSKGSNEM